LTCRGLYATVACPRDLHSGARFAKGVNKAGIEEEEHETDS
jgi:hypothetical protein